MKVSIALIASACLGVSGFAPAAPTFGIRATTAPSRQNSELFLKKKTPQELARMKELQEPDAGGVAKALGYLGASGVAFGLLFAPALLDVDMSLPSMPSMGGGGGGTPKVKVAKAPKAPRVKKEKAPKPESTPKKTTTKKVKDPSGYDLGVE